MNEAWNPFFDGIKLVECFHIIKTIFDKKFSGRRRMDILVMIGVVLVVWSLIITVVLIILKLQRFRDVGRFQKIFVLNPRVDREAVQTTILKVLEKFAQRIFSLQLSYETIDNRLRFEKKFSSGERESLLQLRESLRAKICEALVDFYKAVELAKSFRYVAPPLEDWARWQVKGREEREKNGR